MEQELWEEWLRKNVSEPWTEKVIDSLIEHKNKVEDLCLERDDLRARLAELEAERDALKCELEKLRTLDTAKEEG